MTDRYIIPTGPIRCMTPPSCLVVAAALCALLAGCGAPGQPAPTGAGGAPSERTFEPMDRNAVVFWDRQTTETAQLLRTIVGEFNAGRQGLPVKVENPGGYDEIFRKITASIQAGKLPALAVAYESMTTEYVRAGAVRALDDFVQDVDVGLAREDLDDFFPAALETNRYPQFGGKMYSFPFCKSVLMMYFNKRVLARAGFTEPPKTWDEFIEQCRQVKARTGHPAYAISVDCSTIDGMIFSLGGEVVSGNETRFDSPEALRAFTILETLVKEGLAYQIQPNTYDDRVTFAQDKTAFFFRSSSHRPYTMELMGNDPERWGMAMIPQGDPANPRTVLYGPNICIFNTTPEQERVAWEFIKTFTSKETSVRWALGTGYVPIRKSAAENPDMQAFWREWEYNRAAFDCLPFAHAEPNVAGWQEVRTLVERAETDVLTGLKTAAEAVRDLKAKADAVLQEQ